jgi:hypothetical protein
MGLNPDKIVHAINCGSNEEIVDVTGVTYSPVSYFILFSYTFRILGSQEGSKVRQAQRFNGPSLIARFIRQRDGEASSINCPFQQTTRITPLY